VTQTEPTLEQAAAELAAKLRLHADHMAAQATWRAHMHARILAVFAHIFLILTRMIADWAAGRLPAPTATRRRAASAPHAISRCTEDSSAILAAHAPEVGRARATAHTSESASGAPPQGHASPAPYGIARPSRASRAARALPTRAPRALRPLFASLSLCESCCFRPHTLPPPPFLKNAFSDPPRRTP